MSRNHFSKVAFISPKHSVLKGKRYSKRRAHRRKLEGRKSRKRGHFKGIEEIAMRK